MSVSLARRILAERLLPPEVLDRALFESLRSATPLLEVLLDARRDIAPALSDLLGARHRPAPDGWSPDRALVAALPPGMCERLLAFPIHLGRDGEVEVAAADPGDPHVVREFVSHLGRTVIVVAAPLAQIFSAAGVRFQPPLLDVTPIASERPIPLVRRSAPRARVEGPPSSTADYEPISPLPSRPVTAPPPTPEPPPVAQVPPVSPVVPASPVQKAAAKLSPAKGIPAQSTPAQVAPPVRSIQRPGASEPGSSSVPSKPRSSLTQTRVSTAPRPADSPTPPVARTPTARGLQSPLAPPPEAPRPAAAAAPVRPPSGQFSQATFTQSLAAKSGDSRASSVFATKPATPAKTKGITPTPAEVKAATPPSHKEAPSSPLAGKEPASSPLKEAPSRPTATKEPVSSPLASKEAPSRPTASKEPVSSPTASKPREAPAPAPTPSPPVVKAAVGKAAVPEPTKPATPASKPTPPPTEVKPAAPVAPKPVVPARPEPVVAKAQAAQFRPAVPLGAKTPAPFASPAPAVAPAAPAPAPVPAPAAVPQRPSATRTSLADVEKRLASADHPDHVARALSVGGGSGTIVFAVRPDQLVVRAVGGRDDRPELSVTREGPSVMRVAIEQDEYLGPLFEASTHEPLKVWIPLGTPVFAASVKVRDRATLVLMLDAGADEEGTRKFGRKMAELAAKSLEDLIVRRKRSSHP